MIMLTYIGIAGDIYEYKSQMDNLSVSDKHYNKKYEDMQVRVDKLYARFTDMEKKTFMKSFLEEVNIYEQNKRMEGY